MDADLGFMRVVLSCTQTYAATSPDLPSDSKESGLGRWKQRLHHTQGLIDEDLAAFDRECGG
jgi:hypothetical protein